MDPLSPLEELHTLQQVFKMMSFSASRGDPRHVGTWDKWAEDYPMQLASAPYFHDKDLQYVVERYVPDKATVAGKRDVDMGCGSGVDHSPKIVEVTRHEENEPNAHIESLKLRSYMYQRNLAKFPGKEKDSEGTLKSLKSELEAWKKTKVAREKVIKEGKQKPTFLEGDMEDEKCMSDIQNHFGGAKVDLILAIWVLQIVAPSESPGQNNLLFKQRYAERIAKTLLIWS